MFERCDSIEDIQKSNQVIKITMTIATVLSIYAMHALFRFTYPTTPLTYFLKRRLCLPTYILVKDEEIDRDAKDSLICRRPCRHIQIYRVSHVGCRTELEVHVHDVRRLDQYLFKNKNSDALSKCSCKVVNRENKFKRG